MIKTNTWMNKTEFAKNCQDKNLYTWLVKVNNLTEALKNAGIEITLKVINQSIQTPYDDEIEALIPDGATTSWVRSITLERNSLPLTFARVVVPKATFNHYQNELNALGSKPIGNTLLYSNSEIRRNPFQYKLLTDNEAVFQEISSLRKMNENSYWARRSVFQLPKGHILISEYFLQDLPRI